MNSLERIERALSCQEPERVPMFELLVNGGAMEKILDRSCFKAAGWGTEADPNLDRDEAIDKMLKDHIDCYKKLKLDMLSVFPATPRHWKEKKTNEFTSISEVGTTFHYLPETDQAFVVDVPIKSPEDLDSYVMPDPLVLGRTDYVERARKMVGEEMALSCWLPGIVEFTYVNLVGLERFILYLHDYPLKMERLLDNLLRYVVEVGKTVADAGADVVWFGNDTAYTHGPVISPTLHRKFIVPRLTQIVATLKKKSLRVINHSDGKLYPILDDLVGTGIDALHSLEPKAGMRLKDVKEKYGDRICLIGNVDTSYTLPFGKPEDVDREVRECIRAGAPGGGYILSSANSISKAVPTENVYAMFDAGIKYGKYPIQV